MTHVLPDMTETTLKYYIDNIISNGDTLVILDGTLTINTEINSSKTFSLMGKGYTKTKIKSNVYNNYNIQALHWTATIDIPMRISGITFEGYDDNVNDHSNLIQIQGICKQLRIDNCYWTKGGAHSIMIDGDIEGLIDHNIFIDDSTESISTRNTVNQNVIWSSLPAIGTVHAVFIEDNDFYFLTKGTHAITSVNGQRTVFRNNYIESTITGALIDFHGNYENDRGTYSFEVYDNEIYLPGTTYIAYGIYARSGKGVIYDNIFKSLSANRMTNPIILTNYRSWTSNVTHPAVCSETVGGTVYNCNVHTYEDALLYDSIREAYIWNNRYYNASVSPTAIGAVVLARGHDQDHIQEDRDYFNYEMPDYTPYTYPHPANINPALGYPVSIGIDV